MIETINSFAVDHPISAAFVALAVVCAAVAMLLRIEMRRAIPYEWPDSPKTGLTPQHEEGRGHLPGPGQLKLAGVKVCTCGRIVDRRSKRCQCQ